MKQKYILKRNPKILGQVVDVEGSLWDVRDIRDTKHGFDLLFGSPDSRLGSYRGGLPRLIATKPLIEYWDANRTKRGGVLYDLPAGRTTLKRVRHRFGFHVPNDTRDFYEEHMEDLRKLSAREFAARHDVDVHVACDTRRRLLGNRARPHGWWRTSGTLAILRSTITLREIGENLGISISQAHRLKNRVLGRRLPLSGPQPSPADDDARQPSAAPMQI
jgi:hypothetical protein